MGCSRSTAELSTPGGPEARDVVAGIDDKIRLVGQPVEVAHEFTKRLDANIGQREDIEPGGANPTCQLREHARWTSQ